MADLDPTLVRLEAERRVQRALALVEQAQHTLEAACQELSPVIGAALDWERVGKLAERVHNAWRKLAYTKPRAGYDLDEFGRAALAKRHSEGGRG